MWGHVAGCRSCGRGWRHVTRARGIWQGEGLGHVAGAEDMWQERGHVAGGGGMWQGVG